MGKKVGIDSIAYYVPGIYLDIETLALKRDIVPAKLQKGLGLTAMAICDAGEDAATMAAEAVIKLMENENIDPRSIGRLYMGTESALDAAKPTSTYVSEIVETAMKDKYGERCMKNCDVLDMTFACVGGVDAMMNCLDYVRAGEGRRAIVVVADNAKYALSSSGEYTQGAGAVAMLLTENPRLCVVSDAVGVGMQSVGDFYKPHHSYDKKSLIKSVLEVAGVDVKAEDILSRLTEDDFWGHRDVNILLHRDEPVFDGPLSNDCYCARIDEALADFSKLVPTNVLKDWPYILFHQPYAYQGRRMIVGNWVEWIKEAGCLPELENEVGYALTAENKKDFIKAASKVPMYLAFVNERIERGERASTLIGNMYTGSIFMSLISTLRALWEEGKEMKGVTMGCFSYGSGSKSKVFTLTVSDDWKEVIEKNDIFTTLENRKKVDFDTYEGLHTGEITTPVSMGRVRLEKIGDSPLTTGLRYYKINQ